MSMHFPELTNGELFEVLMYGKKPSGGYTINDYVEEWNRRVEAGMKYTVDVPPISKED